MRARFFNLFYWAVDIILVYPIHSYITEFGPVTLDTLEELQEKLNIQINIWTRKNRQSPLKLSWEGSKQNWTMTTQDVDIFSTEFDYFSNPNLVDLSLILNISEFTKKHKYKSSNNTFVRRNMTFFQGRVWQIIKK